MRKIKQSASSATKLDMLQARVRKLTDHSASRDKVAYLTNLIATKRETSEWIVDSGTSTHMTNSVKNMTSVCKKESKIEVAKADAYMKAEAVGKLEFQECILKDVMVDPDLSSNLLSVSEINKNGGEVTFKGEEVIVRNNNLEALKGYKSPDGLYKVLFKRR
ncbi:uncharacterized protein LOC143345183 isoform X2 [Colletes latitarsis]|uniref:uncharacterized protein LOC143345183 isoform X2 n=1 Tax=Colletes latitarsis TaxID=2605962 RepID=UPI004035C36B